MISPGVMLVQMLFLLALPVGAIGFFGWLALRYVRTREREATHQVEGIPDGELAKVQDMIISLQSEIHALRERQDFIERLLERPRSGTESTS